MSPLLIVAAVAGVIYYVKSTSKKGGGVLSPFKSGTNCEELASTQRIVEWSEKKLEPVIDEVLEEMGPPPEAPMGTSGAEGEAAWAEWRAEVHEYFLNFADGMLSLALPASCYGAETDAYREVFKATWAAAWLEFLQAGLETGTEPEEVMAVVLSHVADPAFDPRTSGTSWMKDDGTQPPPGDLQTQLASFSVGADTSHLFGQVLSVDRRRALNMVATGHDAKRMGYKGRLPAKVGRKRRALGPVGARRGRKPKRAMGSSKPTRASCKSSPAMLDCPEGSFKAYNPGFKAYCCYRHGAPVR